MVVHRFKSRLNSNIQAFSSTPASYKPHILGPHPPVGAQTVTQQGLHGVILLYFLSPELLCVLP